jgi:hypothetical protein
MMHFFFAAIVLGGMAIGAWLVVNGHPWFALLIILSVGGTSMSQTSNKKDQ